MNLHTFLQEQLAAIPVAKANYEKLKQIKTKEFDFGGYKIYVHFNPARAVSSLAKLDAKSIAERPCFLCAKNRIEGQTAIDFKGKYDICINPFPICDEHFTVVSKMHELQSIEGKLRDFLDLAKQYSDFIALFNGAKSGASAPDHMHFQLVNKDYFPYPIETQMPGVVEKIVLRSNNAEELEAKVNAQLELLQRQGELPASHTNLFCEYKNDQWVFTIFPRIQHRPRQFFSEGDDRLMMSPGAIDMTGHLIAAREEDFEKITKEVIIDIFQQISGYND
jgi:ATP adenylyltransferase/5',5'''-P-1,P-4-tetraphosphate phosphorylase II